MATHPQKATSQRTPFAMLGRGRTRLFAAIATSAALVVVLTSSPAYADPGSTQPVTPTTTSPPAAATAACSQLTVTAPFRLPGAPPTGSLQPAFNVELTNTSSAPCTLSNWPCSITNSQSASAASVTDITSSDLSPISPTSLPLSTGSSAVFTVIPNGQQCSTAPSTLGQVPAGGVRGCGPRINLSD